MFYSCNSLGKLPDISVWNTNNLQNIDNMFTHCLILNPPDISKWNLGPKNRIKINQMFSESSINSSEIRKDAPAYSNNSENTINGNISSNENNEEKDDYENSENYI